MLKNLRIRHKLLLLVSIFIFGFLLFGIFAYKTITDTKFDGETYDEISMRTDLIADILPPPQYIIESQLTTYQILNEDNKENLEKLKNEYISRHDIWVNTLPEGDMKKTMVEDTYTPVIEYYNILSNEFIPAIKNGDKVKAEDILETKLTKLYSQHRENIDKVV